MTSKFAAALLALVTAVGLSGCQTPAEEQVSSFVLYSGRSEELIQPLIEQFTEQTGISVDVRYASSAELAAQILEEGSNSPMDAYLSQDAGALGAVAKAGVFTKLPDEALSLVPKQFESQDGHWVGISGRARVLSYNPDRVTELPKSVFDLAGPQWRGRIGIAPTNASFQAFVTGMRIQFGDEKTLEWLKAIKANGVVFEKNSAILEAVETGVVDAGLINHYYYYERGKEVGFENLNSKIAFFESGDIGNLVNVAGLGIRNYNSATKAFLDYLLSETGQKYFAEQTGEYPLIANVGLAFDLLPLSEIPAPQIDLSDLDTLEQTLELIRSAGLI